MSLPARVLRRSSTARHGGAPTSGASTGNGAEVNDWSTTRDGVQLEANEPVAGGLLPLYTPAEAAELLAVRESWLRRRATARAVPCTFLGKHLRFSHTDVVAIAAAAAQPVGPAPRRRPPNRRRR